MDLIFAVIRLVNLTCKFYVVIYSTLMSFGQECFMPTPDKGKRFLCSSSRKNVGCSKKFIWPSKNNLHTHSPSSDRLKKRLYFCAMKIVSPRDRLDFSERDIFCFRQFRIEMRFFRDNLSTGKNMVWSIDPVSIWNMKDGPSFPEKKNTIFMTGSHNHSLEIKLEINYNLLFFIV